MPLESLHFIAIFVIFAMLIFFIRTDIKHKKANSQFPSLLITVGIAFTFLGVALGLMEFNTDDPAASLSYLVDGIKTAFWGSLTGVFASIILKLNALFFLKEHSAELDFDDKVENYYRQQTELLKNTKILNDIYLDNNKHNEKLVQTIIELGIEIDENNKNNMQDFLGTIVESLSGVEEIQRNTQNLIAAEISELRLEFIEYSNKQAEINTKIFISALENTIDKFNEKLIAGMGENFNRLNQSVNRLVEWQDNYAKHVEDQTVKYSEVADNMSFVKKDFNALVTNITSFSTGVEQVESSMKSFDDKNAEFCNRISAFYNALDAKVIDIGKTNTVLEAGFKQVEQQLIHSDQFSRKLMQDITLFVESSHKNSLEVQVRLGQELHAQSQNMHSSFERTQQILNSSLQTIEANLNKTLNQSLMTLGQQLGSLSSKFAKDYEPITENLKKVLDSVDVRGK